MPWPNPTCCTAWHPVEVERRRAGPSTRSSRLAEPSSEQHLRALGHVFAVQIDVAGERARHQLRRTFVAQDLLDRVGNAAGIGR